VPSMRLAFTTMRGESKVHQRSCFHDVTIFFATEANSEMDCTNGDFGHIRRHILGREITLAFSNSHPHHNDLLRVASLPMHLLLEARGRCCCCCRRIGDDISAVPSIAPSINFTSTKWPSLDRGPSSSSSSCRRS
jgi:hypothetical protein